MTINVARIRTIKPEFWGDEKLAPLPAIARLVFLGLISMADDAGRVVDNVKTIDGFIFSSTEDSSRDSLGSLAASGRILRYESDSGQRLIQIANWLKHQKVDKPSKYVLPPPTTGSRESREVLAEVSRSDLRPTTYDLGPVPTTVDRGPERPVEVDFVQVLTADYDFGQFEPSIAGICRSARHGQSVVATLRMHLTGEMSHEHGTPAQVGLACQQYLAKGEPFNAAYFAGFVKRAKRGIEQGKNRERNAAEDRFVEHEQARRDKALVEEQQADQILERFADDNPERFAELQMAAERAIPKAIAFGRKELIRAQLISLIRSEKAA